MVSSTFEFSAFLGSSLLRKVVGGERERECVCVLRSGRGKKRRKGKNRRDAA